MAEEVVVLEFIVTRGKTLNLVKNKMGVPLHIEICGHISMTIKMEINVSFL
jgi:hypothetical protein